jgi:hypothetical protein
MVRTWLSIRIDLVEGHGEHLWTRPGRIFAAARSHTFAQLARAIDDRQARRGRLRSPDPRAQVVANRCCRGLRPGRIGCWPP